jgi:hypothetical protein
MSWTILKIGDSRDDEDDRDSYYTVQRMDLRRENKDIQFLVAPKDEGIIHFSLVLSSSLYTLF